MTLGDRVQTTGPSLVHKPMHRAWLSIIAWTVTLAVSVTFCFVLGCGGDASSATDARTADNTASKISQNSEMRDKLVGVWLGEAYLDENKLTERLEDLPQQQIDNIIYKAQYFVGTVMAIDFKSDGTLENQIEIAPPGAQPISQEGQGSWQIIDVRDEGVVVEIAELNPDGSKTTSRKAYKFYEDGDHFAVSIPLDGALGECNPMIVFERQYLDEPHGSLAEAPGKTQMK